MSSSHPTSQSSYPPGSLNPELLSMNLDMHRLGMPPDMQHNPVVTSAALLAGNTNLIPKFPPPQFDVPDIMLPNQYMNSTQSDMVPIPTTLFYSSIDSANTYSVTSPLATFPAPQQPLVMPMMTINQSQVTSQLGFKTVSPKQGSPTNSSNSTSSPIRESSEDSDDSLPLSQLTGGLKRPAEVPHPEPQDCKPMKKPKTPKRKKKKDPNEPQKPVSAYALFFRDTQAAIKGQNHNASFGEVSKIVASMWDSLNPESKNEYKRRTEEAKKEYLKALAAYRASIVSQQSPLDQEVNNSRQSTGYHSPPGMTGGQKQPVYGLPTMSPPMSLPVHSTQHSNHFLSQSLPHLPDHLSYGQLPQTMASDHAHSLSPSLLHMLPTRTHDEQLQMTASPQNHMNLIQHNNYLNQNVVPAMCMRNGCNNIVVENPAWDNDYCSNDCVITHCRNAFTEWVAARQGSYTHVK